MSDGRKPIALIIYQNPPMLIRRWGIKEKIIRNCVISRTLIISQKRRRRKPPDLMYIKIPIERAPSLYHKKGGGVSLQSLGMVSFMALLLYTKIPRYWLEYGGFQKEITHENASLFSHLLLYHKKRWRLTPPDHEHNISLKERTLLLYHIKHTFSVIIKAEAVAIL